MIPLFIDWLAKSFFETMIQSRTTSRDSVKIGKIQKQVDGRVVCRDGRQMQSVNKNDAPNGSKTGISFLLFTQRLQPREDTPYLTP